MIEATTNNSVKKNVDKDNNNAALLRQSKRLSEKYELRPRSAVKRLQAAAERKDLQEPDDEVKSPKTAPLSKYRRKTANARERHRMREINAAFATLRGVLPALGARRRPSMTKITTLKLATSYIQALSDVLTEVGPPASGASKSQKMQDEDEEEEEEDHLSGLLSDDSFDPFPDIPHLPDPLDLLLENDIEDT